MSDDKHVGHILQYISVLYFLRDCSDVRTCSGKDVYQIYPDTSDPNSPDDKHVGHMLQYISVLYFLRDCIDVRTCSGNDVYQIYPDSSDPNCFDVYCEIGSDGNVWTV